MRHEPSEWSGLSVPTIVGTESPDHFPALGRGYVLIYALILSASISTLAVGAFALLRPARQNLDMQAEFSQAHWQAEAALQTALARLDKNESAAFQTPVATVTAKSEDEGRAVLLTVQGQAPSRQVETRERAPMFAVVTLEARAVRTGQRAGTPAPPVAPASLPVSGSDAARPALPKEPGTEAGPTTGRWVLRGWKVLRSERREGP